MKRAKSRRTRKEERLLDSQRPRGLAAICDCHRQTLKVKVNKALAHKVPPLQLFGFRTRKLFSGRSPENIFPRLLKQTRGRKSEREEYLLGEAIEKTFE